ncbi:class I SAM-dependent methyltransferase [Candidatus Micrarchaeota archaeon]|nr:class I SAM-dependent methyltransferase [Candidatus Micrarchaeota archaeon]
MKKPEHYFTEEPTSEEIRHDVKARLRGRSLEFKTATGVFSYEKVDKGTQVLVKNMKVNGIVLDLGCGYGPVGIAAAPEAQFIVLRDINKRACKYAKNNIKLNGIRNAKVSQGNLYDNLGTFETILCNPPTHAGLEAVFKIISDAPKHLTAGGNLQLVARPAKGGKRMESKMRDVFGNVKTLGREAGYAVYMSVKK